MPFYLHFVLELSKVYSFSVMEPSFSACPLAMPFKLRGLNSELKYCSISLLLLPYFSLSPAFLTPTVVFAVFELGLPHAR